MAFTDTQEPTAFLTDPAARTESYLGQPFADPGAALDWLSPTHIVSEFLELLTGYDFFGEAAEFFSGDWEMAWNAAGAFEALGRACQGIGINLSSGNLDLDQEWDGRAADAAHVYFMELASAISTQQIALHKLADQYARAAQGTWRLAQLYSGILKDIYDAALIAAIAATAGTATLKTGVGPLIGYSVAAFETWKILTMVDRAKKIMDLAIKTMNGIAGVIGSTRADAGEFLKYPLPGGAYDHPAVA
jgi:hypothetical protein